ncbi:MAG TPA: sugar ABC transporter substrate-binding protein [bacterium]|nr:sugar ABC transporter substrate-binding protein [bacterium]HQP98121.1 sugar ABC transporter substrate-binding protein [bacterium]
MTPRSLMLMLLALSACSGMEEETDKIRLDYYFNGTPVTIRNERKIIEWFEREHPDIDIVMTALPWVQYFQKLQISFVSGDPPDVFWGSTAWTADLVKSNLLLDLNPFIERDINLNDIYPETVVYHRVPSNETGHFYAWCDTWIADVLSYNQDLFEQAGQPLPNDAWSYEDFRQAAIALSKDKDNDGILDIYGVANIFYNTFGSLVWSFGGEVLSAEGTRCLLNEPAATPAWDFLLGLAHRDKAMAPVSSFTGLSAPFMSGRIAMAIGGTFMLQVYSQIQDFRWNVEIVPHHNGNRGIFGGANPWCITASCPYPDAAWEFVRFRCSPEVVSKHPQVGKVPVWKAMYTDPRYDEFWNAPGTPSNLRRVMRSTAPHVRGYGWGTPRWSEWTAAINTGLESLLDPHNPQPKEEGIAEIVQNVDKVLQRKQ